MSRETPLQLTYNGKEYCLKATYDKKSHIPSVSLKFESFDAMMYWISKEEQRLYPEGYKTKMVSDLDFEME